MLLGIPSHSSENCKGNSCVGLSNRDLINLLHFGRVCILLVFEHMLFLSLGCADVCWLSDPNCILTCSIDFMQVVSVRDIYSSRIDASFKNPQQRRLLRFGLTDGISEAVAIEFSPIPFITEEIAPGTKVSSPYFLSQGSSCAAAIYFGTVLYQRQYAESPYLV